MAEATVLLTGANSALGSRVADRLRDAGMAVVPVPAEEEPDGRAFLEVDAIVHLGPLSSLRAVLAEAADHAVDTLVLASSATVYGAWPHNPVPLTEDAPLRPNPGFSFAAEQAEGERLAAEWSAAHPAAAVAVLRLVPVVLTTGETWLSATVARPSLVRTADDLPPVQVIHVDDAARAVVHAVEQRLEGTFNVAPVDSVPGETARALSAAGVPVPLPGRAAVMAERLAWRLRVGGAPRPAEPYRTHPWVVASDLLRATGWVPGYTAEEALVACRKGSWWRELSPKRRQEVALGGVAAVIVASAAGATVAIRAARRRARVR